MLKFHLVAAEGVKMCQTLCHLATLLPDPVVATSDVAKSAPSLEFGAQKDVSSTAH